MPWTNNDGLIVKFHKEEGTLGRGGAVTTDGPLRILEIELRAELLSTTQGSYTDHGIMLPKGARIAKIEIESTVTWTGLTTLTLGALALDRTTVVNATGILNAVTTAGLNTAPQLVVSTVAAGAGGTLVGTVLAAPIVISAVTAGVATAGRGKVRIYWTAN